MSSRFRVWRVGSLVLSVAACGSDPSAPNDGVTCGEGTALKNGMCIPQCGVGTMLEDGRCVTVGAAGAADQGGSANQGGHAGAEDAGASGASEADAGSAGETENTGGTSGLAGDGGSSNGGSSSGNGGSAGLELGGSGGVAGLNSSGNGGSAGFGVGGSSGSGGAAARPQWLAIGKSDGMFAYDLSKFPSTLVSLDSKSQREAIWSPDGSSLLYEKPPNVYCRDMTAAVPGSPRLMATVDSNNNQHVDSLSWSADAKTAALTIVPVLPISSNNPRTLQVFDPTEAVPTVRTLSTAAGSLRWAPAGDRAMYSEQSGVVHVRRIQSGVPGPDLTFVGGKDYSWSPDGNAVAYRTNTDLYVIDLTQTSPTPTVLTHPSIAAPTMDETLFTPDGASMLFVGAQVRDGEQDLFKVAVKPTAGTPVRLSTGLTGTAWVVGFKLSPDGKWVIYTVGDVGNSTTTWAVDLSQASPGAPFQISTLPIVDFVWVPNGSGNLLNSNGNGIAITDLPNAITSPLSGVSGSVNSSLAPSGALLAYGEKPAASHLYVRDLAHQEIPAADIPFLLSVGVNSWSWSPSGHFIATVEGLSSTYQLRLVRLDGLTPSNALAVSTSDSTPGFYWQPANN